MGIPAILSEQSELKKRKYKPLLVGLTSLKKSHFLVWLKSPQKLISNYFLEKEVGRFKPVSKSLSPS